MAADPESQRALQELRNRDREVRAHEQARARVEMARNDTGAGPVRAFAEVEAMDDSGLTRQGGRLDLFV